MVVVALVLIGADGVDAEVFDIKQVIAPSETGQGYQCYAVY